MKLLIDIPEDDYNAIRDNIKAYSLADMLFGAVQCGIPLPKGHGELIDKDVVLDMMNHGILEDYITTMGGVIPADK